MKKSPRIIAGRLRSALDDLRGSYWFLPMVMAVGGAIAAVASVVIDRTFSETIVSNVPWIAETEADGTRAVLSVIAGSMITVTGVVFSITIVALTLASSQFGPRLLRNFLRDRPNQLAFGTFVATFLFSLIVLRSVRDGSVPHMSSALAVLLATLSLFVLIYFIHHTASSIQASSVIAAVAAEIDGQLGSLFPERLGQSGTRATGEDPEAVRDRLRADGRDVRASRDGFIRVIDQKSVLRLTTEHDVQLDLRHRPGDFVFRDALLGRVGPAARVPDDAVDELCEAIVIGDIRSAVQDLGFLIGQLVETAVRALSPGVNDPRTAIDCTRRLGALVAAVADREMPSGERLDEQGRLRVLAPATTFEDVVGSCFDPIRRYGASQTALAVTLVEVISRAGEGCDDASRRQTLLAHIDEVDGAFERGGNDSARDRAEVAQAVAAARKRLRRS